MASPFIKDELNNPPASASPDRAVYIKDECDVARSWAESDIITLVVGKKRKAFLCHSDLLVSKSSYFSRVLSTTKWQEDQPKVIYWDGEDDKSESVRLMIDWFYDRKVNINNLPEPTIQHATETYKLAHNRRMTEFKNAIVDALRVWLWAKKTKYATIDMLTYARELKLERTQIYPLLVKSFVWGLRTYRDRWDKGGKNEDLFRRALGDPKVAWDVTQELAKAKNEDQNPGKGLGCFFHEHEGGLMCKA